MAGVAGVEGAGWRVGVGDRAGGVSRGQATQGVVGHGKESEL